MSKIHCHLTGTTFDPDHVQRTPYRTVPSTNTPFDMDGVNVLFPQPARHDERFSEKMVAREQAIADVKTYEASHVRAGGAKFPEPLQGFSAPNQEFVSTSSVQEMIESAVAKALATVPAGITNADLTKAISDAMKKAEK